MRYADLDLRELFELDPDGGVLRFGGDRAVIMDTAALGVLRAHLIETFGLRGARSVLTRFGYAIGWRLAETMRKIPWEDEREFRRSGGRIHQLLGHARIEPLVHPPGDPAAPFGEANWHDSFEADEHLLHCGRAEEPSCYLLTGVASGFASGVNGRELDVVWVEDRCRARGDATCHIVARTREQWGPAIEQILPYYRDPCLDSALEEATRALKRTEQKLRKRRAEMRDAAGEDEVAGIVVKSEPMKRVIEPARRIAKVDATVLVVGESGAGKERIARLIHDESSRAAQPFLAVNCGALSETLLESELFGHARGAFTGASNDRAGLFEAAHGGTLLLDEVGEISPAMQVKLLRVLQEREVMRVGESRTRKVDVRVLAATNRELHHEVEAGRFRKDLLYRLRVVELRVPPLRERRDDILPLARMLLTDAGKRMARPVAGFAPRAADQLLRYDWPGNVRELENAIERAVALAERARIDVHDLPEEVRAALPIAAPAGRIRSLDAVEREYILAVLAGNQGNQAKTAKQLGIGESTLYRKLKSYGGKRG